MTRTLNAILAESAKRHHHLCPRQVLGARMSLYAADLLGLELPRLDKRLFVTSETDGCTLDGIIAATHCRAGGRTLRILDLGKVAATFTDIHADSSIRIAALSEVRSIAEEYAPKARNRWEAMLLGYQVMPLERMFSIQIVQLNESLMKIISSPGKKVICESCGEEIINGREVMKDPLVLCRTCAGDAYYQTLTKFDCEAQPFILPDRHKIP